MLCIIPDCLIKEYRTILNVPLESTDYYITIIYTSIIIIIKYMLLYTAILVYTNYLMQALMGNKLAHHCYTLTKLSNTYYVQT